MSEQHDTWRNVHSGAVAYGNPLYWGPGDEWEKVHVLTDADLAARDADLVEALDTALRVEEGWRNRAIAAEEANKGLVERIAGAIEAMESSVRAEDGDAYHVYRIGYSAARRRAARIAREVGRG